MESKTQTWYKQPGVTCQYCGEYSANPLSMEWWDAHYNLGHALKYWLKRRFKR